MEAWLIILIIALSLLALAGVLLLLFLFVAILPGRRNGEMERYKFVRFAHRGLHRDGSPENSLSAFEKAKEAGFGIELDVRLSKDGELVVFHDPTLTRMCGIEGKVIDYTTKELSKMSLCGTEEGIPSFRQVLELIDGAVPLLIEIKMDNDEKGVAERLLIELEGYSGDYIVESFNPLALRTVRRSRPSILLGILSCDYMAVAKYRGKLLYRLLQDLRLNFLFRPDFIAYDKNGHSNSSLRYLRRTFGTPLFAWTVRSQEEEKDAIRNGFDSVIFEDYIPQ